MDTEKMARILLITSVIGLTLIALSFGILPEDTVPYLYETPPLENVNQFQLLRANMGAMLASVGVFLLGLLKPKYFKFSTVYMTAYMTLIAGSRIFGFIVDEERPTTLFLLYFGMEISIAIIGFIIIQKWRIEGKLEFLS